MFEAIKYQWRLRKLDKECKRIKVDYAKHKKGLSGKELEELRAEEGSVIWPVLDEIDSLKTGRFYQIANRLMVPLPDYKDKELWQDHNYVRGRALTSKGFWELKKLIRQEKRERREGFVVWLAVLTGIIGAIAGVIAAMTGLVIVLTRGGWPIK